MLAGNRISALIPAINEEGAIGLVVSELLQLTGDHKLPLIDEVIVIDNGSTDATPAQARIAGARVVFEPDRGYGAACLAGMEGMPANDIVLFLDGDYACYSSQASQLCLAVCQGADLAIGSRTLGCIQSGAMPFHQRAGTWFMCKLVSLLWRKKVTDLGPFRAIRREVLEALQMEDQAFGWTVEMQIKALDKMLVVVEIPVDSRARIGQSKISGSLRGSLNAGYGIFKTIVKLRMKSYAGN